MGHWMVERASDLFAGKLFQAAWNKVPRRTNFGGNKILVPGRRAAHSELGSIYAGPKGLEWNSDPGIPTQGKPAEHKAMGTIFSKGGLF